MMTYKHFYGNEIQGVFGDLAQLRIKVFRDFPYLYEGTLEYEKEYLKVYANSKNALLFAVFDDTKMIGATTCIPLMDETEEVQKPFVQAGINLDTVFYFGESILLSQYRGLGIGNRFFEERENHARSFGNYSMTCFCAVNRPVNHPLKPLNYKSLDEFWTKRGYQKNEKLQSEFEWLDIDKGQATYKTMTYWTKNIKNES
jgi:GNAT superfamily N-acetyltransferase